MPQGTDWKLPTVLSLSQHFVSLVTFVMVSRLQRSECRMKKSKCTSIFYELPTLHLLQPSMGTNTLNSSVALVICSSCISDICFWQDYPTVSICKYYKNAKSWSTHRIFSFPLAIEWAEVGLEFFKWCIYGQHIQQKDRESSPALWGLCWGVRVFPLTTELITSVMLRHWWLVFLHAAEGWAQLLLQERQVVSMDTLWLKFFISADPPSC